MKCSCGWTGDIQEACVFTNYFENGSSRFKLVCPKCQRPLSYEGIGSE